MVVFSVYFCVLAVVTMVKSHITFYDTFKDHKMRFTSLEFWIIHIPPFLVLFVVFDSIYLGKSDLNEGFWVANALTSLFIWMRLLSFLQSHEKLSFIISMLIASFKEMKDFLIIFFIGVLAFSDSIKSLRQSLYSYDLMDPVVTKEDDPSGFTEVFDVWFGEYYNSIRTTYYISLGSFDSGETDLYSFWTWPIFFLCTILNIIILLNLVIAIVCDIFTRVLDKSVENRYFLMAK